MAVALRLTRKGRTKRPFYRIVAADAQMKRDGRFLEMLGTYDTLQDPPAIRLDAERVKHWIGHGATPSETVQSIISKEMPGYFEEIVEKRRAKIQERRAKRKNAKK